MTVEKYNDRRDELREDLERLGKKYGRKVLILLSLGSSDFKAHLPECPVPLSSNIAFLSMYPSSELADRNVQDRLLFRFEEWLETIGLKRGEEKTEGEKGSTDDK